MQPKASPNNTNFQAPSPAKQHQILCLDALACNWRIRPGSTIVDLYPITPALAPSLPMELEGPIEAFAAPRAVEAPPIDGMLVHAVISRRNPTESFRLLHIRPNFGSVHGVSSQARRMPDFSQLDVEDQIDLIAKSEVILAGLSRNTVQAFIDLNWRLHPNYGLLLPRQAPSHAPAHLTGQRPASWTSARLAALLHRARPGQVTPPDWAEPDEEI